MWTCVASLVDEVSLEKMVVVQPSKSVVKSVACGNIIFFCNAEDKECDDIPTHGNGELIDANLSIFLQRRKEWHLIAQEQ